MADLLLPLITSVYVAFNTWFIPNLGIQAETSSMVQDQAAQTAKQEPSLPERVYRVEKEGYFVLINVKDNWEKVYLDGQLLEENLVSTGAPQRFGPGSGTPLGRFRLVGKLETPSESEYGPYYLGLSLETPHGLDPTPIGLHGTNEPELIGQDASHGCVRHYNETIVRLVQMLPIGTVVETIQ